MQDCNRYVLNPTLDRWIVKVCMSTQYHISYLLGHLSKKSISYLLGEIVFYK